MRLLGNDVDHHTTEEGPLEGLPELGGLVPLARDGGDGLGDGGHGGDDAGLSAVDGAGLLVGHFGFTGCAIAGAFQVAAGLAGLGAR